MKHRIVVALGGNALQLNNSDGAETQKQVAQTTAAELAKLLHLGHEVVVSHGNGPQVGAILLNEESGRGGTPAQLDSCSAMTQGEIGYWLQQALHNELNKQGLGRPVMTIITQTLVDFHDPAFKNPTKPIGPFYADEAEAKTAAKQRGFRVKEDSGRGWRRVVPSPKPLRIIEEEAIRHNTEQGIVVIAAGGGGIPVIERDARLIGMEAVIDKDFAAVRLAEAVHADTLLILTGVPAILINFGTPEEYALHSATITELQQHIAKQQFPAGSMLPKIEATIDFVSKAEGRRAIITSPALAAKAIAGEAGTVIRAS